MHTVVEDLLSMLETLGMNPSNWGNKIRDRQRKKNGKVNDYQSHFNTDEVCPGCVLYLPPPRYKI